MNVLDFADDQSTLVQVMAWCRQATSHYLSQCWPRSLLPYGVTRPQWVNISFSLFQLSGAALVAVGLYLIFGNEFDAPIGFLQEVDSVISGLNGSLIMYAAYAFIGIGVFVIIVGFCGCCGAIKENKCMLGCVSISHPKKRGLKWRPCHTHFMQYLFTLEHISMA